MQRVLSPSAAIIPSAPGMPHRAAVYHRLHWSDIALSGVYVGQFKDGKFGGRGAVVCLATAILERSAITRLSWAQ